MLKVSIFPEEFHLLGINVGLSVVMAWAVLAVVFVFLVLINLRIRRFQEQPRGLQNLIELAVESLRNFAVSKVGHCADFVAPMTMTMILYVFFTTFVEIFGLPPATEDINCTFALGLFSFICVNITGLRFKGLKGRIHALSTPSPIALPIRMLTDMITPFSMAIRLFANVLVGGVIMKLIYMVIPVIIPAAIAAYFNLLHVMIQTFVFALLSLTYTGEALE